MKNKKVKAVASQWKPVELKGSIITNSENDFSGFMGLEIMENYDDSFVKSASKKVSYSYKLSLWY